MLFNSVQFLVFFPIVFALYWSLSRSLKFQNLFILGVSYLFYSCWDYRFLSLIILSSVTDYLVGLAIAKQESKRKKKYLLYLSLFVNLGMLCLFKYFNFFIESFAGLLDLLGLQANLPTLNLLLPVGISFYTFQTISYTVDVYRDKIQPESNWINFFAYVSFFPQLVAGPIERAVNFLPQFSVERKFEFEKAKDGARQILFGFFKKVAIADNCAMFVNPVFEASGSYSTVALILGVIFFAIQLYCDFSGYSDIAIGIARLLGFDLSTNFRTPYFSTSTAELWRRWHITLSDFVNEYIFLPLSIFLSNFRKIFIVASLFISFTVIGLWHGANWTYVFFGMWNGMIVSLEHITIKRRRKLKKILPTTFFSISAWFLTLVIWMIGLVLFRSESLTQAIDYFTHIYTSTSGQNIAIYSLDNTKFIEFIFLWFNIVLLFLFDWINRTKEHGFVNVSKFNILKYIMYLYFSHEIIKNFSSEETFIYFQF